MDINLLFARQEKYDRLLIFQMFLWFSETLEKS